MTWWKINPYVFGVNHNFFHSLRHVLYMPADMLICRCRASGYRELGAGGNRVHL